MNSRTFTLIKPEAVRAGHTGDILQMIEHHGFRIVALRQHLMSRDEARRFYAAHRDRPFYDELVEYMVSGPIVAAVVERDDAVEALRRLVGPTDPQQAAEGTIRRAYGKDRTMNAIHASDSPANARLEWQQLFSPSDILP